MEDDTLLKPSIPDVSSTSGAGGNSPSQGALKNSDRRRLIQRRPVSKRGEALDKSGGRKLSSKKKSDKHAAAAASEDQDDVHMGDAREHHQQDSESRHVGAGGSDDVEMGGCPDSTEQHEDLHLFLLQDVHGLPPTYVASIFGTDRMDAERLASEHLKEVRKMPGSSHQFTLNQVTLQPCAMVPYLFHNGNAHLNIPAGGVLMASDHMAQQQFDPSQPKLYCIRHHALPLHTTQDTSGPWHSVLSMGNTREQAISHADELIGGDVMKGKRNHERRYLVTEVPMKRGVYAMDSGASGTNM